MESIPTDNARLTAAIRDGSREAFDEMCGRYYAPLMAYARLFLKGNWAQDIVQDVFVNVWIRRETLDPRQSLYGYLLRSVYNQSVNYVNKNRHAGNYRSYHQERIESIGYAYYDPDNNPIIEKIYSQDLRAGIDAAVAALPEKCREVFTLELPAGIFAPRNQRTARHCAEYGREPHLPRAEGPAVEIVEIGTADAPVFHFPL